MTKEGFYTGAEIRPMYDDIVSAYQAAFAGEPWNEVSKCVDVRQRCVGGLSATAIGAVCGICDLRPTRPAYDPDELTRHFDELAASRPTVWYAEKEADDLAMAAVAWQANAATIAEEKYPDVPAMADWLGQQFGSQLIIWVDEVFANRQVRAQGNLRNFGQFVTGLAAGLGSNLVAYRTIALQMTGVATRDFGQDARVFQRNTEVPDRRDVVIIKVNDKEKVAA